ncbi:MAG: hypothetical protein AABY22_04175, partial [Nanoarchaeota archaeon]
MKSVKEYVSQGDEKISNAIDLYEKIRSSISGDFCAVCDSEMGMDDFSLMNPKDFLVVCKNHRRYAACFQSIPVRAALGFPLERNISYDKISEKLNYKGIKL